MVVKEVALIAILDESIGPFFVVTLFYVVVCVELILIVFANRIPIVSNSLNVWILASSFVALLVVNSALVEYSVSDRGVYLDLFQELGSTPTPWSTDSKADPVFLLFMWILATVGPSSSAFLFGAVAATLAVCYLVAGVRVLPRWAALCALLTLAGTGLFTAYSVVALRQGLALCVIIVAVAISAEKSARLWRIAPLLALAPLVHWSAAVPALILGVIHLRKVNMRQAFSLWAVLALAYLFDVQERLLSWLTPYLPQMETYSSSQAYNSYGSDGNRLAFLLVSAVVLLSTLSAKRLMLRRGLADPQLDQLLITYTLFNCLFLALGFIAFADRVAAYSWIIVPLVIWRVISQIERPALAGTAATLVVVLAYAFGAFSGVLAYGQV